MPSQLVDIETQEVSLVGKPANNRRFLLFKSKDKELEEPEKEGEQMKDKDTKEVEVVETEVVEKQEPEVKEPETQEPATKVEKQLSEDQEQALLGALNILRPHGDVVPEEVMAALEAMVDIAVEPMMGNPSHYDEMFKGDSLDLDKAPEELRGVLAAIWKERTDAVTKAREYEEKLAAEQDAKTTKEFLEKAKGFNYLPVEPEEFGQLLKTLSASVPDSFTKLEQILKAADEAIAAGNLYGEVGTSRKHEGAGDAYGKMEAIAKELVAKSEDGLSMPQAIQKAMEQNPQLYAEYLAERAKKK